MTKRIRVLLADDHPVYREGLRVMLESDDTIEVVAEASNGSDATRLASSTKPDVMLLDINMPGANGVEVAKAIQESPVPCTIMFVTMEKSSAILQEVIDLEVDGYFYKNSNAGDIIDAVKVVAGGERYYSPAVEGLLTSMSQSERILKNQSNECAP